MADTTVAKPQESYTITVNGVEHSVSEDKKLIRWLRDDLGLKSVKDGCSQGACGTCTVIIDGEAKKACTTSLKKLDGKSIVTVEGLTDLEKEQFVYAFGKEGAVQCGFCIPGMVISGKALLDKNDNPTQEDVKQALKGNICRCTGYKKIIDAIMLVGALRRGEQEIETQDVNQAGVGSSVIRIDVRDKVLGNPIYGDDLEFENLAHGSCVRSAFPRARVLKIDTSEAEALEGVIGVLTAKDVPNNKVGHIQQDWDVFIPEGTITHMEGDALCLVVAETEEILEQAKKLVKVEYEELETVSSIEEARAEGAPLVHANATSNLCNERHVSRGNAREAIERSKYVRSGHFSTPFTEHAFLEPEVAIAFPYKDGVKILTSDQGVYDTRKELNIMFNGTLDVDSIVVENNAIGGGFGGKEDVSVQHIAALAAHKFQRHVKCKFTRDESLKFHPKRHPMEEDITIGVDENGIIQGMIAEINFDTGAYASLSGPVLERACTHSVGPYAYENTEIHGYSYYTNNVPAGAFRGFGVCQSNFAFESLLNLLAEDVGISPWEIRYRNAIEPGKVLPNGQIADCSTALKETLLEVKEVYEANKDRAGIACAMKNAGVGVGIPDKGRCRLVVKDGVVEIYSAASDIGQGCATVFIQVVCETLKVRFDQVRHMGSNSEFAPDSGTTSGSRQTLLTGEAVRGAAQKIKDLLDAGKSLADLEGQEFFYEYFEPTDPLSAASEKKNPKSHIAYGYATHVAILDDEGKVSDIYACHDSGKVVNPISIMGQIEGGVLMGMGYALTEDFKMERSKVKAKFGTLGLLKATDIPSIHASFVEKDELLNVAYGSKGIGEIATIPTAPAVQGAYYARDGVFRTSFPMEDTAYRKAKK